MKYLFTFFFMMCSIGLFAQDTKWYVDSIVLNVGDSMHYAKYKNFYDSDNNIIKEQTFQLNGCTPYLSSETNYNYNSNKLENRYYSTFDVDGAIRTKTKVDYSYGMDGYTITTSSSFNIDNNSWNEPSQKSISFTRQLENDTIHSYYLSAYYQDIDSTWYASGYEKKELNGNYVLDKGLEGFVDIETFSFKSKRVYASYYKGNELTKQRTEYWQLDNSTNTLILYGFDNYEYCNDQLIHLVDCCVNNDGSLTVIKEEKYDNKGCLTYRMQSTVDEETHESVPYRKYEYNYDENGQRKFKATYLFNKAKDKYELEKTALYDNYYNSEGDIIRRNATYEQYIENGAAVNKSSSMQFRFDFTYYDGGTKEMTVYERRKSTSSWIPCFSNIYSWYYGRINKTIPSYTKNHGTQKNFCISINNSLCGLPSSDVFDDDDIYLNNDYSEISQIVSYSFGNIYYAPQIVRFNIFDNNDNLLARKTTRYSDTKHSSIKYIGQTSYEYDVDNYLLNTVYFISDSTTSVWISGTKTAYEYYDNLAEYVDEYGLSSTMLKTKETYSWNKTSGQWIPSTRVNTVASDETNDDKRVIVSNDTYYWNEEKQNYIHDGCIIGYLHSDINTGIKNINNNDNKITFNNGLITSSLPQLISVYTINGTKIYSGVTSKIQIPSKGLYIIKSGNTTKKIQF